MKRVIDISIGLLLSAITLPLVLLAAASAGVALRAWPFFVQERIGGGGRPLHVVKIRTLPRSFPRYALKNHHDVHGAAGRILRFLRSSHLDELPQLWLVLAGRMSLVGPRPKLPDDAEPVLERYNRLRTMVPQGCTGLWQIGLETHRLPSQHPEYDYAYIRWWSVRMDLWVLWRTVMMMLGVARPISLDQVPRWARGDGLPELSAAELTELEDGIEAPSSAFCGREPAHPDAGEGSAAELLAGEPAVATSA